MIVDRCQKTVLALDPNAVRTEHFMVTSFGQGEILKDELKAWKFMGTKYTLKDIGYDHVIYEPALTTLITELMNKNAFSDLPMQTWHLVTEDSKHLINRLNNLQV